MNPLANDLHRTERHGPPHVPRLRRNKRRREWNPIAAVVLICLPVAVLLGAVIGGLLALIAAVVG